MHIFKFLFIAALVASNHANAAKNLLRSSAFPSLEASSLPAEVASLFVEPNLGVLQAMRKYRIRISDLNGSNDNYSGFALNLVDPVADPNGYSLYVDNLIPYFENGMVSFRRHVRMYFSWEELMQQSITPYLGIEGKTNIVVSDGYGSSKEFQVVEFPSSAGRGASLLRQTVSVSVHNILSSVRPNISVGEIITLNREQGDEPGSLQLVYSFPKSEIRPELGALRVLIPLQLEDRRGKQIPTAKIIDFGLSSSGDLFVIFQNDSRGLTRLEFFDVVEVAKDEILAVHRLVGRMPADISLAAYQFRACEEHNLHPMEEAFRYRASRISDLPAPPGVCETRMI